MWCSREISDSEVSRLAGIELNGSLVGKDTASSKLSILSNDTFENFLFLGITAGLLTVYGDYNRQQFIVINNFKILIH